MGTDVTLICKAEFCHRPTISGVHLVISEWVHNTHLRTNVPDGLPNECHVGDFHDDEQWCYFRLLLGVDVSHLAHIGLSNCNPPFHIEKWPPLKTQ